MGNKCCNCASDKTYHNGFLISNSSNDSSYRIRRRGDARTDRLLYDEGGQVLEGVLSSARLEDGGQYTAEAWNRWGVGTGAFSLDVTPRVPGAPVFLRRLTDLAVKIATRTRFLVEITSPTDLKVTWTRDGQDIGEGERFHLVHEGSFYCVDVAPVTLQDSGRWTCTAANAVTTATCFCRLKVLVPKAYKKPEFLEELRAVLTAGGTVSLECKVVGVPTPNLRWFKDDKEIKAGDMFALRADPRDPTSLGSYTCEATNCMGRATSTSRLNVSSTLSPIPPESFIPRGPAPIFSQQLRDDKVKIGGIITLECKVKVPPWPLKIQWYNKEGEVVEGGRYHVMADGLGMYSIRVDPVEGVDDGLWKCVATSDQQAKAVTTGTLQVTYPKTYRTPKFLDSLKAILTEEGLVSFECKVVGYPTPNLRWYKDGQELKPGDVYQLTGTNSLGSYCCIAHNCMGEASSTAELTIEDIQSQLSENERAQLITKNQPPRFLQGLKSTEGKINEVLTFTVKVSVSPEPTVLWFRDDEPVEESEKFQIQKEAMGDHHLHIKKLEFVDQAEWKCVAANDYGQSVTSCFLKLNIPKHYKKPKFLENLKAVLSEEGAVNLECKVIGVPQPVLKWYKDGKELNPGDIHKIISGQDGTCCLGTYTCVAQNCMGTASSSASLLSLGERQEKPEDQWRNLARNTSLSTIQEERTSQLHDTTEKSVTIDERAEEISFSFDGKEVSVSLYETPDLTEEEALQIVEMYADQLSEHVTEHNVVELPPLRFTKESSHSGNILMEAVVIDVSQDYFSAADDDLRTDADMEEFSFIEDQGQNNLTPEDDIDFDKINNDLDRALASTIQVFEADTPLKPKRTKRSDRKSLTEEMKMSGEEEISQYTDASENLTQKESFKSLSNGSPKDNGKVKDTSKESTTEIRKKKLRGEKSSDEASVAEEKSPILSKFDKRKHRKSTDSEKEDDSLREFEKLKKIESATNVPSQGKKEKKTDSEVEDDSLHEFENRKIKEDTSIKESESSKSKKSFNEKSESIKGKEKVTSLKKDLSSKEEASGSVEKFYSGDAVSVESKNQSTDFQTAEDMATDKSEISVLESLAHSLKVIQKGLSVVETQVIKDSKEEPLSAKGSLSLLESLTKPLKDIQKGLEIVENQINDECQEGRYSPNRTGATILETLAQPICEFQKNLALIEQQAVEAPKQTLLEKTTKSIIENLVEPMEEMNNGIFQIKRRASEHLTEFKSKEANKSPSDKSVSEYSEKAQKMSLPKSNTETLRIASDENKSIQQSTMTDMSTSEPDDTLSTSTDIDERKKLMIKSISLELEELEESANLELAEYYERLMACGKVLQTKADAECDLEVRDILICTADLVNPLRKLTKITSQSISDIVENYENLGIDPSSTLVHSLTQPLEALKNSLQILENVATCETHKQIRCLAIPAIYKLTVPMEELNTTVRLVENLSSNTAMEFLTAPLKNLSKAVGTIERKVPDEGLLEELYQEGPVVVKALDNTFEAISNCICTVEKNLPEISSSEGNKIQLKPLLKPIEEFQKLLHFTEDMIEEASKGRMSPFEIHQFVQELNKPLQAVRVEFSLLQHQIEAEHYGEVSTGNTERTKCSKMINLVQPLEAIQDCINKFHESLVCKPPEEPMHLRYVLYGLMELAKPLNSVCTGMIKTEEAVLSELKSLPESHTHIKEVLTTVRELKEANDSLKIDISKDPDVRTSMACDMSFKLLDPLQKVEDGLVEILGDMNKKDLHLKANILKTMAEPFNILQKTLIKIEDEMSNLPSEHSAPELKQALQGVQRSILVVQDQVSFEYGNEPSSIESNISLLKSLVQPMQLLKQTFSDIHSLTEKSICDISRCKASLETVTENSDLLKHQIDSLGQLFGKEDIISTVLKPLEAIVAKISHCSKDANNYISSIDKTIAISTRDSLRNSFRQYENDLDKLNVRCSIGLKNCKREEYNTLQLAGQLINDLTGVLSTCVKRFGQNQGDEEKFNKEFTQSLEKLSEKIIVCENKLSETAKEIMVTRGPLPDMKMKGGINVDEEITENMSKLRENFSLHVHELQDLPSEMVGPLIDKVSNDIEHLSTLVNVSRSVTGDKTNVYERITALAHQVDVDLQKIQLDVHKGECESHSFSKSIEAVTSLTGILSNVEDQNKPNKVAASLEDLDQSLSNLKTNLKKEIQEGKVVELETKVESLRNLSDIDLKSGTQSIKDTVSEIKNDLKELSKEIPISVCESIIKGALASCEKIEDLVNNEREEILTKDVSLNVICPPKDIPIINNVIKTISNMNRHFIATNIAMGQNKGQMVILEFLNNYENAVISLGESTVSGQSIEGSTSSQAKIITTVHQMTKLVSDIRLAVSNEETIKCEKVIPLIETLETSTSAIESLIIQSKEGKAEVTLPTILQNLMTPLRVLHSVIQSDAFLEEDKSHRSLEISQIGSPSKSKAIITQFAKASSDLEEEFSKFEESLKLPKAQAQAAIMTKVESLLTPVTLLNEYVNSLPEFGSDSESLYEKSNISILKTLAEPVQEIKKAVIKIQEQVALEAAGTLTQAKSKKLLAAIATPIKELKANVALIQEQANILSANESLLMESTYHKTAAKELVHLKEAVSGMVQSGVLQCETMKSDLAPKKEVLIKLIEDIQLQLANINEQEVLEPHLATFSVKDTMKQIARPVYELQRELAFVQEQEPLSYAENVPEKSSFGTLAKSLLEVCKNVVEVIENKFFEVVDSDENTIQSDLPTLASTGEYDYERGTAKVEERVVLQDLATKGRDTFFPSRESGIDASTKDGESATTSEKSINEESGIEDNKICTTDKALKTKGSKDIQESSHAELVQSKVKTNKETQPTMQTSQQIAETNLLSDECDSEIGGKSISGIKSESTKINVVQMAELSSAQIMPQVEVLTHKDGGLLGLIEEEQSEESEKTLSENNSVIESKSIRDESMSTSIIKDTNMGKSKDEKEKLVNKIKENIDKKITQQNTSTAEEEQKIKEEKPKKTIKKGSKDEDKKENEATMKKEEIALEEKEKDEQERIINKEKERAEKLKTEQIPTKKTEDQEIERKQKENKEIKERDTNEKESKDKETRVKTEYEENAKETQNNMSTVKKEEEETNEERIGKDKIEKKEKEEKERISKEEKERIAKEEKENKIKEEKEKKEKEEKDRKTKEEKERIAKEEIEKKEKEEKEILAKKEKEKKEQGEKERKAKEENEKTEKEEKERIAKEEKEKKEKERIAKVEKEEKEKKEKEEKERIAKEEKERMEKQEKERIAKEEKEKKEKEEKERAAKEEKERMEKQEKERIAKEEKEKKEKEEKERAAKEEKEKIEKERIAKEEKERMEKQEKERIAKEEKEKKEKEEKERAAKEEKEKIEKERIAKEEKEKKEKEEKERAAKEEEEKMEKQEKERIAKEEKEKKEKEEIERKENERIDKEKKEKKEKEEKERIAKEEKEKKEKEEKERLAKEEIEKKKKEEKERIAKEEKEKKEKERIAKEEKEKKEKEEKERIAKEDKEKKEKEEKERIAKEEKEKKEKEEKERIAKEEKEKKEKAEKERIAKEEMEMKKKEEKERIAKEEKEKKEKEEKERIAKEEKEKKEKEEKERIAKEEKEKKEKEEKEKERIAKEEKEKKEKAEKERIAKEEKEKKEKERIAKEEKEKKEKAEKERIAKEEKEKKEKERIAKEEKEKKEKEEKERIAKEEKEKKEKEEKERIAKEEKEKKEKEEKEKERIAKEEKEKKEKAEKERIAKEEKEMKEKAEKERIAKEEIEKKEKERIAKEEKEKKEKAEKERIAKEEKEKKEKAEKERIAKEEKEKKDKEEKERIAKEGKEKKQKEEEEQKAKEEKEKKEKEIIGKEGQVKKDKEEREKKENEQKKSKVKDDKENERKKNVEKDKNGIVEKEPKAKEEKENKEKEENKLIIEEKEEQVRIAEAVKERKAEEEIENNKTEGKGKIVNVKEEKEGVIKEKKEKVRIVNKENDLKIDNQEMLKLKGENESQAEINKLSSRETMEIKRKPSSTKDSETSVISRKSTVGDGLSDRDRSYRKRQDYTSYTDDMRQSSRKSEYEGSYSRDSSLRSWKTMHENETSRSDNIDSGYSVEGSHISRLSTVGGPLRKSISSELTLDSYSPRRSVLLGSSSSDIDPANVRRRTDYLGKSRLDSRLDNISSLGELPSYTSRHHHSLGMHLGPIRPSTSKFSRSFEHLTTTEDLEQRRASRESKPTFSVRLMDRTVVQGSTVKLTCSIVANPEPSIEWLKDAIPITDSLYTKYQSKITNGIACLEISKVVLGDAGNYSCIAKNKNGQAISSACLKVFADFEPSPAAPVFTKIIKDSYKFKEDKIVLECKVQCQPPPSISWFKDGHPLSVDPRFQQTESYDGVCQLTVFNPETSDSGCYTCKARNQVSTEQISHYLFFPGRKDFTQGKERQFRDPRKPAIAAMVVDREVPAGGTFALQVQVTGTPRPDITWLREGKIISTNSSKIQYIEDKDIHTLLLHGATPEESGKYTCRVSNKHGSADSTAEITVLPECTKVGGKPPEIVNKPDSIANISVGDDIMLAFHVAGDPKPQVSWTKGIHDLTNSGRCMKETFGNYVRLTMKRANVLDSGTYFILAKNVYGSARAFVTVKVRDRARSLTPTISSERSASETSQILKDIHESMQAQREVPGECGEAEVVDVGRNWVTLSWKRPDARGAGPILAYKVEAWSTEGARWIELGMTGSSSLDVFNLNPGSVYKFRVTARNRYGWGEPAVTKEGVTIGTEARMPEFTKDLPGQIKTLLGHSVNLTCEVEGEPRPDIQWFKDGSALGDRDGVRLTRDAGTCSLDIDEATIDHEARYTCEATNRAGRVSTFARLMVVSDPKLLAADSHLKRELSEGSSEMAPQFTMRLRDRRVQMTYPVRLTCQVAGLPEPMVLWTKDGIPIVQDNFRTITKEGRFHTLELCRAMLEDAGEYSARATNEHGSVACNAVLTVDKGIRAYVAPEFIAELPERQEVSEGSELHLRAHVEAYPSVGITWFRDGVRLRPSRQTIMTLDREGLAELRLRGANIRNNGLYTCIASNTVGVVESSCQVEIVPASGSVPQEITVKPPEPYSKAPLFVTKPRSTEAVEGDIVVILCEVVGDPKPDVTWLRDWLKPEYYKDGEKFKRIGDGPEYRLEIRGAKLDHTGAYSVLASNQHGQAKAVISLQIKAKGLGKEAGGDMGSVKQSAVETLPLVTRPMRDMRCCDGDSVVLECSVHGSPEPDIRWEKDGRIVHLGEETRSSLEDERARLHIARVYPEDEGVYTCVASNNLGKATTSACLIVDVAEEKEWLVSGELSRPTAIRSAGSTPRSTPRSTPARSPSPNVTRGGHREYTGMESRRQIRCSPRFYSVPHDRVAEEGETVRMTASARGMPSPWTTWTKDGKPVTPSARLSVTERDDLRVLEIRAVTKEDAGTYRVALENDYGRVESSARLDVIVRGSGGRTAGTVRAWGSSPSFSRRLSGSTSHLGTDFTFSADVQSTPSPSISWYRNGKMLVRNEKVVPTWDGRTARLEVFGLEEDDAGVYTCVAENCMGRTRCSAELVVLGPCKETSLRPPVFVQGLLDSSTATEGQPFELLVQLQGSEPMDAVWIKDGVEVPDCPDFRYVSYGKGRFGLRIADPFTADSGVYNCEVFSQHGEAVSTTDLRVIDNGFSDEPNEVNLKRLHFTKTPTPVITSSGSSAKFCVKVSNPSDREPNFIWEIAGNAVKASSERFKIKSEGDESVFEISPVAEGDTCEVFCEVTVCVCEDDCEGCLSAKTGAQLRVSTPPDRQTPARILSGPADTTALAGDRVILQATFQGHPKPNVRWLRQGREMETSARVRVDTGKGVTCLVLEPVLPDDSAKYILTVENSLGSDCGFASLAVEGCPEPPSGAPCVSQSGAGAVTVAWSSPPYDGGSKITGYTVEISESDKDSWTTLTDRCLCLSHIAQDLKLGTCYSFRVRSHNIHGASEPSPQSSPLLIKTFEKEEETSSPEVEHKQVQIEPGQVFREGYDVLEELGKGRYGVVHKVVSKEGSRSMAAKFVRCIMKQDREKVYEEIDIMNCLRHPKLLQLYAAYENPKDIIMIMEYISGGELFERVVADDFTLTEKDCILFMRQICDGVGYMHRNSVVHLDLKPENIMCSTRTSHQIKLIDFGLAQKLKPDSQIRVLQGTPEFIPPEIVNYEPIGTESDMWSVGVICYVLLSGLSPFMGDSDTETFTNITRADYDFEDEAFESISKDAKDFISVLLIKRKEKRLSAEKCLRHKWLDQEDNSMSKVALCTDKLKKFIIHRKWQKTGNAIRALGRMATLSARRNTNNASAARNAGQTRLSSLNEEERMSIDKSSRSRRNG